VTLILPGALEGTTDSGMKWPRNTMVIQKHLFSHLKHFALGTTAALGMTIGGVSFAQADYIYWTGANSTDWTDPGNWSSLTRVPGGGALDTTAVVGSPFVQQPIINVSGVDDYLVRIGNAIAGGPAPLAGTLTITDGGTLTLSHYMGVAYDDNTDGQLTITGAGSALTVTQAHGTGALYVALGANSIGKADISGGASVSIANYMDVAGGTGSVGTVTVDGSTIDVGNNFSVGSGGSGILTILNGSVVTSGTSQPSPSPGPVSGFLPTTDSIGSGTDSVGLVTVSGAGSILTSYNPLVVGGQSPAVIPFYVDNYGFDAADIVSFFQGHGTLVITDGGTVESGVGVHAAPNFVNISYLGGTPGSVGVVTVTDLNSSWTVGGSLVVGGLGQGTLNIANSGLVAVANGVIVAEDAASTGTLNIGAEAGSTPAAPGTLNTPTVTFGAGIGDIVFNHTDTSGNYEFAPVITGGSAMTSAVDVYSGTTVMTGLGSDYFGRTTIYDGAMLAAGAANVLSRNSDYVVQAAGTLDLRGNSQTIGSLANAGLVNMGTGTAPGTILTVNGNYVGQGGTIVLNTFLGADDSLTDKLVVSGSTSGTTGLRIVNAGGLGAQTTGNGIEVVQVDGASNGQFSLTGTVAAGAYTYGLYQNGVSNTDGNWYLRSTIRPDVAVDTVVPAAASRLGLAMLGTASTRNDGIFNRDGDSASGGARHGSMGMGSAQYCADDVEIRKSGVCTEAWPAKVQCNTLLWGRVFGETGLAGGGVGANGSFGSAGPAYSFDYGGFQAGADLYRTARDNAGFYAGAATLQSDVRTASGGPAGRVGMDAYGFGGYWTHRDPTGWYTDLVLQGNWYENIHAHSVTGQGLDTHGWGITASAETGYVIALGGGYGVIPQGQLIYQRTSLQGGADQFSLISYNATDEIYGRLGVRFAKGWLTNEGRTVTTWVETNFWHQFGDDATTTFANLQGANPATFAASLGGTWAQLGLGISGQLTRNVSVFGNADYNIALNQPGHSLGGRAGVRVNW